MNLTPADVADSTGAQLILDALIKRWPWVKHLFGDAACDRRKLLNKAAYLDFTVEVVRGLQG
jgi:putative transposase